MNPAVLKLSISLLCLLAMSVGAFVLASFVQEGADSLGMTVGALLILIPASIMMTRLPRLWKYQVQSLAWYQTTYPESVTGNRVTCFSCGSDHIESRQISQQTGHNGHICGQCRTPLYYS